MISCTSLFSLLFFNVNIEPHQTPHVSLLNLFGGMKPNGPISMTINKSIHQFVDTSQKVVKGVEQIVKSTFEIITGAAGVDTSHLRY